MEEVNGKPILTRMLVFLSYELCGFFSSVLIILDYRKQLFFVSAKKRL